jgi:hypothetical protein
MLIAEHGLAIEMGRRAKVKCPRELRLCRMCGSAVEDEIYIFWECEGDPNLRPNRVAWLGVLRAERPDLVPPSRSMHASVVQRLDLEGSVGSASCKDGLRVAEDCGLLRESDYVGRELVATIIVLNVLLLWLLVRSLDNQLGFRAFHAVAWLRPDRRSPQLWDVRLSFFPSSTSSARKIRLSGLFLCPNRQ